jgi:CBS domain-containing protein
VTCSPDDSLAHAEKLMSDNQVRRMPVIDPEVGIVTLNDLTRATRLAGRRLPAADALLVRTFAEIGGPHHEPPHQV